MSNCFYDFHVFPVHLVWNMLQQQILLSAAENLGLAFLAQITIASNGLFVTYRQQVWHCRKQTLFLFPQPYIIKEKGGSRTRYASRRDDFIYVHSCENPPEKQILSKGKWWNWGVKLVKQCRKYVKSAICKSPFTWMRQETTAEIL